MKLTEMSKSDLLDFLNDLNPETLVTVLQSAQVQDRLEKFGVDLSRLGDIDISEIALAQWPANLEESPLLAKSKITKGDTTMAKNEIDITTLFESISELRELANEHPELNKLEMIADNLEQLVDLDVEGEGETEPEAELEEKAKDLVKEQGITKSKAYSQVCKDNPDLYDKLR